MHSTMTLRASALALAALAFSGCAAEWTRDHPLYCRLDEQRLVRDTLYFGLSIPDGGEVGEADWSRFETDVLARAFPRGYTILDARGAWLGENGERVSEKSRVVVLTHEDDAASHAAVRGLIERYRAMFRQEAVLRERSTACVTFQ